MPETHSLLEHLKDVAHDLLVGIRNLQAMPDAPNRELIVQQFQVQLRELQHNSNRLEQHFASQYERTYQGG